MPGNVEESVENSTSLTQRAVNRRSILRGGVLAGGAALGAGLVSATARAFSEDSRDSRDLTRGDVAILRFLAAAELIESDLWTQYAELGGNSSSSTLNPYQTAFTNLDGDGPQYITSNTLDEVSHADFLNAYLESKGADPVDFDQFRNLQGSTATGAQNIGRLTNLMHLNVDTSWYVRYRSTTNPDMGATYPQAVTISNRSSIPVSDADMNGSANHLQVIANIAAFHFGAIEQGGSSLYSTMARKASHEQTLEIVLSIGGDEVAHFLEWVDFAGNGVQQPVAPVTDAGLTFPDFFNNPPLQPPSLVQPNLIFPVPCEFISLRLPKCAVIRPVHDRFAGARATVEFFTNMNLFAGQSKSFFRKVQQLAEAADDAQREF